MATAVLVMSTIPALGSTNESKKIKTETKQKQKKKPLFNIFFLFFTKKKSETCNLQCSNSVPWIDSRRSHWRVLWYIWQIEENLNRAMYQSCAENKLSKRGGRDRERSV